MYLLRKHKLNRNKACPPSRQNQNVERNVDLKGNRVKNALRGAFQKLRKKFTKNVDEKVTPRVSGIFPAEGQRRKKDKRLDIIKKLCQHKKFVDYDLGHVIGKGGFGHVVAGTRKVDNLPVAVKFVSKSSVTDFIKVNGKQIPSEVYFMHKVQHRHVIKFYQGITLKDYFVYVMERPENCSDLHEVLCERRLTESEVRRYFTQILDATICCEENGVVHRDLKPANILLDKTTDEIKIIDFGLASKLQYEPCDKYRGTRMYMPPELVRFGWYDICQATVWTLGIILVNMIASTMPFLDPEQALRRPPRLPDYISQEAKNLILAMLNVDSIKRPTLKQILRHPWITKEDSIDEASSVPASSTFFSLKDPSCDEVPKSCNSVTSDESLYVTPRSQNSMIGSLSRVERQESGRPQGLGDTSDCNDSMKKESLDFVPQECGLTLSGHTSRNDYFHGSESLERLEHWHLAPQKCPLTIGGHISMTSQSHGLKRHKEGELRGSRDTNDYNDSMKKESLDLVTKESPLTLRGHTSRNNYSHGLESVERHEDGKLQGLRVTNGNNNSVGKESWDLVAQECHLTLQGHILMTGFSYGLERREDGKLQVQETRMVTVIPWKKRVGIWWPKVLFNFKW